MSHSSSELLDFSNYYRQKPHTTQRTGPLPGAVPHHQQLDDMMKHSDDVRESLSRLREVVVSQRQAEEAEASRATAAKIVSEAPPMHEVQYEPEDTTGGGGLAGGDGTKRRIVNFAESVIRLMQVTDHIMQRAAHPGSSVPFAFKIRSAALQR